MEDIRSLIARRKFFDGVFAVVGLLSLLVGLITLLALILDLAVDGVPRLSWQFFTSFPSRFAEQAGILSAWVGTTLVMIVTAATAVPLGVAAGVYLEEYAAKNWMTALIEINIANLAAVPSIVYGLMALGLFVYQFNLGQSILTAGLPLALLILPMVIIATREAIRPSPSAPPNGRPCAIMCCPIPRAAYSRASSSRCRARSAKPPRSSPSARSPSSPFCRMRQ